MCVRGYSSQLVGTKTCQNNYNYTQLTISVRIRSRNVRQVHLFSRFQLVGPSFSRYQIVGTFIFVVLRRSVYLFSYLLFTDGRYKDM